MFLQVIGEEDELIRYGSWSPEAISLDLPPYRSMFLFLVGVPLEVIKEYLQMRLQQKPENPSPLSVRQLMRELKEGKTFHFTNTIGYICGLARSAFLYFALLVPSHAYHRTRLQTLILV